MSKEHTLLLLYRFWCSYTLLNHHPECFILAAIGQLECYLCNPLINCIAMATRSRNAYWWLQWPVTCTDKITTCVKVALGMWFQPETFLWCSALHLTRPVCPSLYGPWPDKEPDSVLLKQRTRRAVLNFNPPELVLGNPDLCSALSLH